MMKKQAPMNSKSLWTGALVSFLLMFSAGSALANTGKFAGNFSKEYQS